jgi:bifunctional enzyme CysN/CysC
MSDARTTENAAASPARNSKAEVEAYLAEQGNMGLLRFLTCGSVDDGKSTLIGRLLFDAKQIFDDQLSSLESDSKRYGTRGQNLDLALLVDGLAAEREQGITIDAAYRFFATEKRKFIVADTPGHEQYTRNMATGASTAELAVILVDARKGVVTQTRRHSHIVALLGIKQIVLAVNKMDLVDYDQGTYDAIRADYRAFAASLGLDNVTAIPLSALNGENVLNTTGEMPWYQGGTLMGALEAADTSADRADGPARFPVQWVNRPDLDFRGYSGTLAAGRLRPGDEIIVLPVARTTHIERIVAQNGDLAEAVAGDAVTLTLRDEIDVSRGDVIASAEGRPETSDQFQVRLIWMHDEHLLPGRSYLLKTANRIAPASISELKYKINVNSQEHEAAKVLELNEIGICNISLASPIAFEPYGTDRTLGSFILIDRLTNHTVAAGMIDFGLRRATNIHWQSVAVDKQARAGQKHQRPSVLWFTGLSGSGKSTIANIVEQKLHAMNRHTYLLDGDNVRHGLNRDLGFTDADRVENIRRVGEVAKLMVDAGLMVQTAFISPFMAERRMVRDLLADGEFVEIFIDTPLEVCEQRDPKGLYEKARAGEIKNFTGYDSPYERPELAELTIDTVALTAEQAADEIIAFLKQRGYLEANGD